MKFQLLSAYINLGGNRDSVTYRGPDNPITYPEALVLQVMHGGAEHVYDMIEVGDVERDTAEELERLTALYPPGVVRALFPSVGGRPSLPSRDDKLPTAEEVRTAQEAADAAMSKARSTRRRRAAETSAPVVPDLTGQADD